MAEFVYEPMFTYGADETEYRRLTDQYVSETTVNGKKVLVVAPEALELLAEQAFRDVSHRLRPSHLALTQQIFNDPEASENDRLVALEMI